MRSHKWMRRLGPWVAFLLVTASLMAVIPPANALWSKTLTMVGSIHVAGRTPMPAHQGCTPGFWKQEQHFDQWPAEYTREMLLEEAFSLSDVPEDVTLLQGLEAGGGGLSALMRHAVAALLNAAHPAVDFAFAVDEVKALFQRALATGDYERAKDALETANEAECPLPIPAPPKAPSSETTIPTLMPEVSTVEAPTATPSLTPTATPLLTPTAMETETTTPSEEWTPTDTPTETASAEPPSAEPETPTPPL